MWRLPSPAVTERSYPQRDYSRPPEAIEILLVRHGASQAAVDGQPFELLEGQADPSLSPEGVEQARRVAAFLAGEPLQALFVTPLCRTAQTAEPIAQATGLEPVVIPELREVHLGELDGGAFRIALAARDPVVREVFAQERWDVIPGAERMEDLAERTRAGVSGSSRRCPRARASPRSSTAASSASSAARRPAARALRSCAPTTARSRA